MNHLLGLVKEISRVFGTDAALDLHYGLALELLVQITLGRQDCGEIVTILLKRAAHLSVILLSSKKFFQSRLGGRTFTDIDRERTAATLICGLHYD